MERYLGGEEIDEKVLIEDLEKAVARGSFFPVIPVCSGTGVGTLELLEVATSGFPSPLEHPLPEVFTPQGKDRDDIWPATPSGPLLAEVVKTTSDPYVGRVSLVRVFSGTIRPDATVHVSGHFASFYGGQRLRQSATRTTTRTNGSARCRSRSASSSDRRGTVVAGDICAIGRLSRAETGDTLVGQGRSAGAASRGRCPSRCCRSPCSRTPRPTTTSCRSGCSDWRPRTRHCGSSRTRRPTRSCSGAWARPTRVSYSTGWPTGSA